MTVTKVRWIRGRRKFMNHQKLIDEIKRTHKAVIGPKFVSEFKKIVANWRHRPGFSAALAISRAKLEMKIYPTGDRQTRQIWKWNVEGTRAHPIVPVRAPALRFRAGRYMAKTGPRGKWYGGPGTVAGGQWVSTQMVAHPGTEPREWPSVIGKKLTPFWQREMENAFRRGVRKMNR